MRQNVLPKSHTAGKMLYRASTKVGGLFVAWSHVAQAVLEPQMTLAPLVPLFLPPRVVSAPPVSCMILGIISGHHAG